MQYELYHHGILGMKWGIRRYQNKDGSLTEAGKKRYLNSDGTLTDEGLKKAQKDYSKFRNLSAWERHKKSDQYHSRYDFEGEYYDEHGRRIGTVVDKTLNAVVDQDYETIFDTPKMNRVLAEGWNNTDMIPLTKRGQEYLHSLENTKLSDTPENLRYEYLYSKVSDEDKRFMRENKEYSKYAFRYMEEIRNGMPKIDNPDDAYGVKLDKQIKEKVGDYYNGIAKTAKARSLFKEMHSATDNMLHKAKSRSEKAKALNEFRDAQNKLLDYSIKQLGYTPSDLTREYFYYLVLDSQ